MWTLSKNTDWDYLRDTFPWIKDMEDVPQDPIYHGEGNVAIHTRMVLEELRKLPEFEALSDQDKAIMEAAALLHDVEKRSTTQTDENGRILSPRHAKKGEYTARTILYQDIPTPFPIREQVAKLVRYHGLPLWALYKKHPEKELFRASLEVDTRLLAMLSKADVLGRICDDQAELLYRIQLFEEFCKEWDCYGKPRHFETDLAKFTFFDKQDAAPDYLPYDDYKCEVILMSGLPGSGKDTLIAKEFKDLPMISLDDLRTELGISPRDSKGQGKVAQAARERMKVHLRKGQSFVFNATSLTRDLRRRNISLFTEYKAKTRILHVEVPYKDLLKQNRNREDSVPVNVIDRMIQKREIPSPSEAWKVEYRVNF